MLLCPGAADLDAKIGHASVSDTTHPVCSGPAGTVIEEDRRTVLRFVLGRPGWRVEAPQQGQGEPCLRLTTPCPDTGGQRSWRLVRTEQGLLVYDEASGQRRWIVPTMREALVEVWEVVTTAARD
jgi:hypothetical protein